MPLGSAWSNGAAPRYRLVCICFPTPGRGLPYGSGLGLSRCLGPGECLHSFTTGQYRGDNIGGQYRGPPNIARPCWPPPIAPPYRGGGAVCRYGPGLGPSRTRSWSGLGLGPSLSWPGPGLSRTRPWVRRLSLFVFNLGMGEAARRDLPYLT